jgi:16S rRNA (guanine527-N7)-methyltransferase
MSNRRDLTNDEIASALKPFGILPTASESESIRSYVALLLEWNLKINLTGLSDPVEIVSRHFGESWYLTKLLDLEAGRLADIGSGAGFPGLALKLLQPELDITLIEQNKKKSAFLAEMVRALSLGGVSIISAAYEDWPIPSATLDFVTARALGQYPRLLKWASPALKPTGRIILLLGDEESNHLQSKPGWSWKLPERVPGSLRRQVLVGSPVTTDVAELLRGKRP